MMAGSMVRNKSDFKKWISVAVSPTLQQYGFEQHESVWIRGAGEIVDLVEFLFEKPRYADSARFTVEIGLFHKSVHQVLWGPPTSDTLSAAHCAVHLRIGRLLSDDFDRFLDKWWDFSSTKTEIIESEVIRALSDSAIPFLESNRSLARIRRLAERMSQSLQPADLLSLAIVYRLDGDKAKSDEILNRYLERPNSAWFERAAAVKMTLDTAFVSGETS